MFLVVHVSMCVSVHVRMYMYEHARGHVYVCMHLCLSTCVCMCIAFWSKSWPLSLTPFPWTFVPSKSEPVGLDLWFLNVLKLQLLCSEEIYYEVWTQIWYDSGWNRNGHSEVLGSEAQLLEGWRSGERWAPFLPGPHHLPSLGPSTLMQDPAGTTGQVS